LDIERIEYNWTKSVYGDISEIIFNDTPPPLGGFVKLTHYQDANLYHNIVTGCSITGILHFMNKMPIDWYSKKQATIKMATYGSKFISARTCINQIVDLRLTLGNIVGNVLGNVPDLEMGLTIIITARATNSSLFIVNYHDRTLLVLSWSLCFSPTASMWTPRLSQTHGCYLSKFRLAKI
jgi:hypothetical protein